MPKIKMQTEFDVPDDVFEQSVEKAIKNNSDYVLVVRCKDCKHWHHIGDGTGDCTNVRFHLDGHADPSMKLDDFCSCGEMKVRDD